MKGWKWAAAALGILSAAAGYMAPCAIEAMAQNAPPAVEERIAYFHWAPDLDAVAYELEIYGEERTDLPEDAPGRGALHRTERLYTNSALIAMGDILQPGETYERLWWRVRPLNLDREPIGPFSALQSYMPARGDWQQTSPLPRAHFNGERGSSILYPVYSFTPMENAASYEVEVTRREPENPEGTAPSRYRVFSKVIANANLYDPSPRIGTYWWRVRAMDSEGRPLGGWSRAEPFRTDPADHWQVAVLGDSISHGGGRLSYGPADWAYSYAHYLDFPAVNLSESGDTSRMTADRFERDVVPFHPEYVLIMTGSNSLRGGVPAGDVIADLKEIQEKARAHGITPILMTLPPINPASIRRAFDQPTAEDWQEAFQEVNAFIRSEPSIDTAAAFSQWEEMPEDLAMDGLHGDWRAKEMMARVINEELPRLAPDLKTF